MENKPKKSKALIITIIVILLLILLGFLLYKNRNVFGVKTSATIAKLFSPLLPSSNTKGVKIITKAGSDIKKGDQVSLVNPIVIKSTGEGDIFGFTTEDIKYNEKGEIIVNNNTLKIGNWVLSPGSGSWTLSPVKGEWAFNINSGKWIAPIGTPPQPAGGWIYDSNKKIWEQSQISGSWVFDKNTNSWVSPGAVPPPSSGGWIYDSNTKLWTLSPTGGEWLFNPNTREWGSPGDTDLFGNSLKITAQAGEDLKRGDAVSLLNPTIIKTTAGSSVFGVANQDIPGESTGEITINNSGETNTFYDSFSRFLNNLFNVTPTKTSCINGAVNYPLCTVNSNNICLNGATNPVLCTTTSNSSCLNGTVNPPLCTITSDNKCLNGTVNPPLCTITSDNKCLNEAVNPDLCTINTKGLCINGSVNPQLCTIDKNNKCLNGNINPPLCTITSDNKCSNGAVNPEQCTVDHNGICLNKSNNPPFCTINSDNKCSNGAVNPDICNINPDNKCLNGAVNPNLCTVASDGKCLNGNINPPTCTIINNGSCSNGDINPPLCTIDPYGKCSNGDINPPLCTVDPFGKCSNGTTNPPLCTIDPIGNCSNGMTNPPLCTTKSDGECLNGTTNPPLCTIKSDGKCENNATNPPICNEFTGGTKFPTVTVKATPSTIASGSSSVITWTSTNATSCDAGAGNGTGTSGSFNTGTLKDSTSYSVTCYGNSGSSSGFVYVNITGGQNIFPTVTVKATPSTIASGSSSVITWTSTNATSCDAGAGNGTGTSGSFNTGTLTDSMSYAISCIGTLGESSGFVNIFVNSFGGGPEGDKGPDLTAGSVTPASALINTIIPLSSVVRNTGGDSTLKSFSSYFAITQSNPITSSSTNSFSFTQSTSTSSSTNSFAFTPGKVLEISVSTPMLSPNTNNTAKISYKFTKAGTYYIRACADKKSSNDSGLITESNENNNCGDWTTFTVSDSLPVPCLSPKITDTETMACINASDCKSPKIVTDNKCEIPGPCLSPNITDTESGACIDPSNCTLPKVVNGKKCELQGPCLSPKITDVVTKACINKADCKSPKVVNISENTCEAEGFNKCLLIEQNPLTFTDIEKAKLAVLLRKFYLISSSLKTVDDISTIYNEIDQQMNFISQIKELTNQCYTQITPSIISANNWKRSGNPWFSETTNGTYPYRNSAYLEGGTVEQTEIERILNIW